MWTLRGAPKWASRPGGRGIQGMSGSFSRQSSFWWAPTLPTLRTNATGPTADRAITLPCRPEVAGATEETCDASAAQEPRSLADCRECAES